MRSGEGGPWQDGTPQARLVERVEVECNGGEVVVVSLWEVKGRWGMGGRRRLGCRKIGLERCWRGYWCSQQRGTGRLGRRVWGLKGRPIVRHNSTIYLDSRVRKYMDVLYLMDIKFPACQVASKSTPSSLLSPLYMSRDFQQASYA